MVLHTPSHNKFRRPSSAAHSVAAFAVWMDARGHVEMLPGLPGSKRPDEEVMLIGFPF